MTGHLRHRLPKGPSSSGEASPSAYRAASRVQIPPTARAEYPEKAISYQETNQKKTLQEEREAFCCPGLGLRAVGPQGRYGGTSMRCAIGVTHGGHRGPSSSVSPAPPNIAGAIFSAGNSTSRIARPPDHRTHPSPSSCRGLAGRKRTQRF